MSNIIVTGLVMAVLVGLPISLIVSILRDTWWGKVLSFIICCSILFGVGALLGQKYVNDCDTFNNGVCVKCGGEYRFTSSTRYRTRETFYYTCQDCGWTIETNRLMNKH